MSMKDLKLIDKTLKKHKLALLKQKIKYKILGN